MKGLIKKLLHEEMRLLMEVMIPTNNTDPHNYGTAEYVTIAQDDKTGYFLLLIVELHDAGKDGFVYSYFFQVFDKDENVKTNRLYKKEDANKYLPLEIKNEIIPLVKKMTVNLVNRIKPNIIKRTAMEYLNEKGMVRYNEISELLQKELGYELVKQGKDEQGKESWTFKRNGVETNLNEGTIEEHYKFNSTRIGKILLKAEKELNESIKKTGLIFWDSDNPKRLL